jgi:hypothetical protein
LKKDILDNARGGSGWCMTRIGGGGGERSEQEEMGGGRGGRGGGDSATFKANAKTSYKCLSKEWEGGRGNEERERDRGCLRP